MWPSKALRLFAVVGLVLAVSGPAPVLSNPSIELTSHDDTPQQVEPPQPPIDPPPIGPQVPPPVHTIHLKSGDLTPGAPDVAALNQLARSDGGRVHILLQLDFIPRDTAKAEYEKNGVKLLAYMPDYAWIASVPANDPAAVLNLPGITWAGPLTVNDKLDPMIQAGEWGSWNLAPDGTAAVSVITHLDEEVATTRALVEKHGGTVTGEVIGTKMLLVEMPQTNITALAAEDAIQWIEGAEPPLGEANDGIRTQIGVATVNAAPYNLNGTGIDVLVYDSGQAGNHTDFGARLIHGDADTVSEHSTHVAGTVGGSGANSVAQGGTTNQWRGMATAVDLISYGTNYTGVGPIFYQNVPDIESDFAAAQNTYGADLGTASLGSNVYSNYPLSCTLLMGKYGASDVLIDQIIRGGNGVVGIGEKYITTWAVGNERNNVGSCSNTYSSIAPPAAAKNPIHVGASNTNNNSMTTFSSWGPTQDGRIKPIVVAGGCQSGGDGGIKSTDNNPVNDYTVMCGTSMATPAVGGSIALMLQQYRTTYATSGNFWPSTAKALLMQTADDFGNPGPDYQWGFGQVDILAAVQLISRTAFLQNNVAQGDIDVFYFPVMTNTSPAQVSLAWDDYEATFNANPTLINNLDVELVAPSGTVWQPWVLNPAIPANNATRGINTRDNQEQVTVPDPEIGTWMVRVKGITVPQGPQDYSLACEGCRTLNAGVCQFKVSGALQPSRQAPLQVPLVSEDGVSVLPEPLTVEGETTGERWQRGVEKVAIVPSIAQGDRETWALIEAAHAQGPAAVLALRDQLTGHALELAQAEIENAEARLNRSGVPPIAPAAPDAVNRVGINGACAYPTIQQAVNAAADGDTIRVSSGVYFENVGVTSNRVITIEGGYNSTCTTPGAGVSHIDGSAASGSTWDITAGTIVLRNLEVSWGSTIGGGIDAYGSAQVTLDNVDVFANHSDFGGGVYVGPSSTLTATNGSTIHDNTATSNGGGVRTWGKFFGYSNDSDVYNNCASDGGGLSVPGGDLSLNAADVYGNQAAGTTGKGGGIHATGNGVVTLTNNVFVYFGNTAYDGAGIHADNARINLANATFRDNTATNHGGGLYLTNNSALHGTASSIGQDAGGLYNEAVRGGGVYAITSTIDFAGSIINNRATSSGGGLYAANSVVTLTNATVGGTGADRPNLLGPSGHEGVGLFLTNNTRATLSNTVVASNTFQSTFYTYGGGALVDAGSVLTLTNSRVERHLAPDASDGRGAGIYVRNATVTLDNSQIISNTAGAVGGGLRLYGGTLNVTNGSSLVNNNALTGEGGALAATDDVTTPDINLSNAMLQHNTAATDGGAIYLNAGTLDATGWWDFRWNNAGGNGGAVAVAGTGDADFYAAGDRTSYLAVNHASGNGGALYVANNDTVTLHATSGQQLNLNTNTAGGDGGAAYTNNGAYFDLWGQILATSNIADGNGGMFYLGGGSRLWLDDTSTTRPQILVNQADNGGAIYASNSPNVECDGADFGGSSNGNTATAGSGGAIYLSGSTFSADNCTFRNNQATANGGAIAAYTTTLAIYASFASVLAAPDMDRLNPTAPQATGCNPQTGQCSAFSHNLADSDGVGADYGGALFIDASTLNLEHTYLHRNSAWRGGAIYQLGTTAASDVKNSLFYSNTVGSDTGSAIRVSQGTFTLTHVTLANNTGAPAYSASGGTSRVTNSIAWGNTGGFTGTLASANCNIDQSGTAGPATNPLFIGAGAAENYHLGAGSPARDACATGLSRDLDNAARPFGPQFDMGAYESHLLFVYLPLVMR